MIYNSTTLQNRQMGKRKYEWWKDEPNDQMMDLIIRMMLLQKKKGFTNHP